MKIQAIRFVAATIITIFIFTKPTMSQQIKDYTNEWKKVEAFKKKNLPKSALTEVDKIYQLAKRDNQEAQVIKALVARVDLQDQLREENEILAIGELEKELVTVKQPARQILQSIIADLYLNYYQYNRYELYSRTATTDFEKDDIATWSTEDFHQTITDLYLASLENERLLKSVKLDPYDAIITKGNARHLRPTLFDLLAHRALDYFRNDESDISKPTYAFEINQAEAFLPAAEFVKTKFEARDSLSNQHKALQLFQRLIAFHLNDTKPDALIDVDIHRLEFVNSVSTHPSKSNLYKEALEKFTSKYGDLASASQGWYLLAKYYEDLADDYHPHRDTTHRFARIKAKEICEKVVSNTTPSEGRANCLYLLNDIIKKSYQIQVENVNLPLAPFRSFVTYRNLENIHFRIIKVTQEIRDQQERSHNDEYWNVLLKQSPIREWVQQLPQTNDLQEHSTEIKIEALPIGEYILLSSSGKQFKRGTTILGSTNFHVSNISYINNGSKYFVLNRETGKPLSKAVVQVWNIEYDYNKRKYVSVKQELYSTTSNGYFRMNSKEKNSRNYYLEISHDDDHLFIRKQEYFYEYYGRDDGDAKATNNIFFFTDRGLYRPGQIVHFKGIAIQKKSDSKVSEILTNYKALIELTDVNGEMVDSILVETNEFGSFSGKFKLPENLLNGSFSIQSNDATGRAHIQVEEYKRPKFYVEYEPVKGIFKLNDTITVTGFAKAYAGNNISGANVNYRIVREPRLLYPWMSWRWWLPPSDPMEIAHGTVKTDSEGKFVVQFPAIPDLTLDKRFEPVFDYTIYADVTDINGETRSGETSISVSEKSIFLIADIPTILESDSLHKLSIQTQNMAGEFEPALLTISISKLKAEQRLIRPRYWERPDQFVMTREEYIKNFPHDEYDNETDPSTWERRLVFQQTDTANSEGSFMLKNLKLEGGFYEITIIATGKNGEQVKDVRNIELKNSADKKLNRIAYSEIEGSKPTEPGGKATIGIGTSAEDVFLIREIERQNSDKNSEGFEFFEMSNERLSHDFSIKEEDRGGLAVSYFFVKHNRVYSFKERIAVPWTNKDLKIEYASFRDKTLPGSAETWKVKITGMKNEKVAAEMLASMYDASLDQFYPFSWDKPSIWPEFYTGNQWSGQINFRMESSVIIELPERQYDRYVKTYDYLNTIAGGRYRVYSEIRYKDEELKYGVKELHAAAPMERNMDGMYEVAALDTATIGNSFTRGEPTTPSAPQGQLGIRKNFNETAFFFPDLRTDSEGAIEFSFTMPEALTRWKFQAFAHTKDLALGLSTKEIITQKDLMVQPNPPRFLREGDKMDFSAKIVNMTSEDITGQVELLLFDASTGNPVDGWFKNVIPNQYFTVAGGQSEPVNFSIEIPFEFASSLRWRIVARAGDVSDGEEDILPVLTNRMLVTESIPINMRGEGTKEFNFDKLINSGNSESITHHSLTVEYTSNPAWYAVQALPYMMEYPYDCGEQMWNRYYANSLATMIANSSPRIKQMFDTWKSLDTAALLSNLQKNQELKSLLIQETPWVLEAKTEAEQKRNLALLFDLSRMSRELNSTLEKLKQLQSSNGGFVWFAGGPDNRYITQYIVTGIGHLQKLKAVAAGEEEDLNSILKNAISYLDARIREDYEKLKKSKTDLQKYVPGYTEIQYLYMRSFFPDRQIPQNSKAAVDYYTSRARATWTTQSKYMQGMIALALHRGGDKKTPADILKSLKETSITHEELGMYWKDESRGWFWYQAPIERQALLIEAFAEIAKDTATVDELKTWLLKNKQTNNWESTRSTAEAVYALLVQGSNWLAHQPQVRIELGSMAVNPAKEEAGTGYIKEKVEARKVKPEMGKISVTVDRNDGSKSATSWGAVYWQYFEDLDKITTASTPLKLEKKLFVEENTDRGPVLRPVKEGDVLKVGDKIKVRIELRVDRDMEFVHMKDMRASAMEPVNVISGYKWQGGLGYYETTKDASTSFFFDNLYKGTYVFEYPMFVTHTGNFSNGITSIQSMYAPEFGAHSEGIRVTVE